MPPLEVMTTELSAVNTMLSCIGESPINTLVGDLPAGIQVAYDQLLNTSREVQLEGWHFNTEDDYLLSRDADNEVQLAPNVLDIDLTVENGQVDLVQRGRYLYDRKNHTYALTFDPRVSITWFLTWTDLPEAARNYIKVRAARVFQDGTVGSETFHKFTLQNELEARVKLEGSQTKNADVTIFDNWDVAGIVSRKRVQTYHF